MASPAKSHTRTPSAATTADADNPQTMVISSLRSQVNDLVSQVTLLNSKLVQSYDRISDLEDNMHIASSSLRTSTLKISQLELERTQHLSALNTGLLVEKTHVTAELTRLMERATDEAARRGVAESARQEIEKDLDDLSAELFGRANTMVAEARLGQAKSERRVQDTEALLKGAEDAVASMQTQMQVLREDKDRTDRELNDVRELMGKGKWVEREHSASASPLRLLSTHAPYQEFLLFVAHLRQIRPGTPQPPPMATLLPLPFLVRLVSEDSDPTLRLDTAPALNWLTRRAVGAAIHQSQLTVEPVSANTLLEMQAPPGSAAAIAAFSSQAAPAPAVTTTIIPCALCGTPVFGNGNANVPQQSTPSWRPAFFSRTNSTTTTTPIQSHPHVHSPTPSVATSASFYPPSASSRLSPPLTPPPPPSQTQVHVFRVPATGGSGPPTLYPLCSSGWCLSRLRTTCEVWRFVRHGVVDKVWAEEVPTVRLERTPGSGAKPPVPPRRRMNVGKLIGFALGKGSGAATEAGSVGDEKFSPPPVMNRRMSGERRRLSIVGTVPPPLPRRSDTRGTKVEEKHGGGEDEKETHRANKGNEVHAPLPVEGATLFDADSMKPAGLHLPANGHANPESQHDPFLLPAQNSVDPAQIPLPPSPTLPSEEAKQLDADDTRHFAQEQKQESADKGDGGSVHGPEAQPPTQADTHPPARQEVSTEVPATVLPPTVVAAALPHHPASTSPVPARTTSPAPPVPRRAPRRAAPVPPSANPKPVSEVAPPVADSPNTDENNTQTGSSIPPPPPVHPPLASIPPPSVHHSLVSESHAPTPPPQQDPSPLPPRDSPLRPRDSSPRRAPEEQEAYVGDVTWEERTWKELVRLREDMFYARVGTAR